MKSYRTNQAAFVPAGLKRSGQQGLVNELGAAILRGEFGVGANLPNEAELTTRFSVSRTVIREVMKTLAAKGLVVAKTKVGTRVSDPENWNMFDSDVLAWRVQAGMDAPFLATLFEMRLAIEPAAAALAAERRSDQDGASLRASLAELAAPSQSDTALFALALDFHVAVAKLSGNLFMASIGGIIGAAIEGRAAMRQHPLDAAARRGLIAAFEAVVAAIEARDAPAARRAMILAIETELPDRPH